MNPSAQTRTELTALAFLTPSEQLVASAARMRTMVLGNGVRLRSLIEFSNHCARDCLYCGLRRTNAGLARFRLKPHEIFSAALAAWQAGVSHVVLQSGDDLDYPVRELAWAVRRIRTHSDLTVSLSIGERPVRDYEALKTAGAEGFLLPHETADPDLYASLHPGMSLEWRVKTLKTLKKIGYRVGTGFIVGLPGQTSEDLVNDLLLVRALNPESCTLGPFLPQAETPLGGHPPGSANTCLRLIAALRLLLPRLDLPASENLASLDPEAGLGRALAAGANVVMPHFTPGRAAGLCRIHDRRLAVDMAQARRAADQAGCRLILRGRDPARHPACSLEPNDPPSAAPSGLSLHIGLFGQPNAGKSSLLNALTGSKTAPVSDVPGTTTAPLERTALLDPLGKVCFIDTTSLAGNPEPASPGPSHRPREVVSRVDMAVLVLTQGRFGRTERALAADLAARNTPLVVAVNKVDKNPPDPAFMGLLARQVPRASVLGVSALTGQGLDELKAALARAAGALPNGARPGEARLLDGLVAKDALCLLLVDDDPAAPKGRLVDRQVQAIREALDSEAAVLAVKQAGLRQALDLLRRPPDLVVCESRLLPRACGETPAHIPLTALSLLASRTRANLADMAAAAAVLSKLQPGDRVLIAEACARHAPGDDLGRVHIPRWLSRATGGAVGCTLDCGPDLPAALDAYRLIIHCDGCELPPERLRERFDAARAAGVPMCDCALAVAALQGTLMRALSPFPEALAAYRRALEYGGEVRS